MIISIVKVNYSNLYILSDDLVEFNGGEFSSDSFGLYNHNNLIKGSNKSFRFDDYYFIILFNTIIDKILWELKYENLYKNMNNNVKIYKKTEIYKTVSNRIKEYIKNNKKKEE